MMLQFYDVTGKHMDALIILGAVVLFLCGSILVLVLVASVVTEWRGKSAERVTTAERTAERTKGTAEGATAEERILARARPYVKQDAARFARDHLVRRKQVTEFGRVYAAFSAWCEARHVSPPSPQQLSKDFASMGIERGKRYVNGVQRRVIVGRVLNQSF